MTAHLGDTELSAILDGESSAGRAHLEGCSPCRARLEDLRSVGRAIRSAPLVVANDRRATHLAIALAAMLPAATDPGSVAPGGSPVVALDEARRGRRWALTPRILGAAAAVVLLGGVAAVVVSSARHPATFNAASAPLKAAPLAGPVGGGAQGASGDGAAASPSGGASLPQPGRLEPGTASAPPIDGGLLGPQNDIDRIGMIVASDVADFRRGHPRAANPPELARPSDPPPCSAEGRRVAGQTAGTPVAGLSVVYVAGVTYRGTPAIVLAFPRAQGVGSLGLVVEVMRVADCAPLAGRSL